METSQVEHGNAAMKTVFLECFKMMWEKCLCSSVNGREKGIINSLGKMCVCINKTRKKYN